MSKKTKKAPLLALLVVDWGGYGYRIQRSFPYFLSGIRAMNFSFCTKKMMGFFLLVHGSPCPLPGGNTI